MCIGLIPTWDDRNPMYPFHLGLGYDITTHTTSYVSPIRRKSTEGDVSARHDDGGAVQGHCAEVAFGASWRWDGGTVGDI